MYAHKRLTAKCRTNDSTNRKYYMYTYRPSISRTWCGSSTQKNRLRKLCCRRDHSISDYAALDDFTCTFWLTRKEGRPRICERPPPDKFTRHSSSHFSGYHENSFLRLVRSTDWSTYGLQMTSWLCMSRLLISLTERQGGHRQNAIESKRLEHTFF